MHANCRRNLCQNGTPPTNIDGLKATVYLAGISSHGINEKRFSRGGWLPLSRRSRYEACHVGSGPQQLACMEGEVGGGMLVGVRPEIASE